MVTKHTVMNQAIVLLSNNHSLIQQIQSILPESTVCHTLSGDSAHDSLDIFSVAGIIVLDDDADNLIETIEFLRGNPATDGIPIMLLADLSGDTLHDALEVGITDYIPKPLSVPMFMHRWHQMVQQHALQSDSLDQSFVQAEPEYQSILASMTDPIFVFDAEGTYLKIPHISASKYYQPPSNLLGKRLVDVFDPELAERFVEGIQTAIRTQSSQILEYDLPIDDGRTYFSAVVNPIVGRDEVVWVARDITRAKLNEIALSETEQRYRQLFENANDMILMVDLDSKHIIDANKKAQTELGYTRSELARLSINDIEVPLQDTKSRIVSRALATSGYIIVEQNYRRKDEITIPVEVSTRLIKHRGQNVLLSFARNIKQRKLAMQAEAEERFFAELLRDSIARLAGALTLDDVLDVMVATVAKIIDCDGVNIMFVEGDRAKVIRQAGYTEPYTTLPTMNIPTVFTLRHMKENQQAIVISDAETDSRWQNFGDFNWVKSNVGAPIILNDETIGYINLDSRQAQHFTNKHRQRLQTFANQSAIAIHNARLYEASQHQAEELEEHVQERTRELTKTNQELTQEITKRRKAEEKLAEEHNILRTIINSLPNAVYVKNRQSEFTLVNYRSSVSSYHPQIGLTDFDLISDKNEAQRFFQEEQDLMDSDYSIRREEHFVNEAGDDQWFIRTKVPLHDDTGDVIGLVGVNQDITEIKTAEQQLRQLLTSAQCLLWFAIVELIGEEYQWNIHIANVESAQEFLPLDTSAQEYTEAWLASIPEDDQQQRETIAHLHLSENQPNYKVEYRSLTRDGDEHWFSEDVQVRQLTAGRWQLIGVGLDTTHSKSAEFALRESHEQLELRVAERTAELQQEIIVRKQTEEAERQQRILAEALQDSITALNNTLNIDDVLDAVLAAMKLTVEHDAANIMLIEGETLIVVRQRGYPSALPDTIPLDAIRDIPTVYDTKQPIIIPDTLTYDEWDGNTGVHGEVQWVRSNIKIPIIYDDQVIGILLLDSAKPNSFTMDHAKLLQTFANQASIALQNARLYQAEHQQRILAETLQQSITALTYTLNIDTVLDTVLDAIVVNIEHEAANIMLIEDGMLKIVRQRGYEHDLPEAIPMDWIADVQTVHDTKRPFIIDDTLTYEAWGGHGDVDWVRCNIKVPIIHDNKVVGIINLDSSQPNQYTSEHADLLQTFANQASIALQNARLYHQAQQEISERKRAEAAEREQRALAETLRDTAVTLSRQLDTNELLETILQAIEQVIQIHDTANIVIVSEDMRSGIVTKSRGYDKRGQPVEGLELPLVNFPTYERLIRSQEPILISDTHNSSDWYVVKETEWIRSHIGLPIFLNDKLLAIINVESQHPNRFTQDHIDRMVIFANQASIALQNARLYQQAQQELVERKRTQDQLQQRSIELELLREASLKLNATFDLTDIFKVTVNYALRLVDAECAHVFLFDGEKLQFGTALWDDTYHNHPYVPIRPNGITSKVARTGETIVINSMLDDTHYDDRPADGAIASLPLMVKGEIRGVMNISYFVPHEFDRDELRAISLLADQSAIAIQNAEHLRLLEGEVQERKRAESAEREQRIYAETLRDTAITLNQQLDTPDLFKTILKAMSHVISVYDTATIIVMNADGVTGRVVAEQGFENFGGTVMGLELDLSGSKAKQRLIDQHYPLLISDTHESDSWIHMDETAWIRSHISLPIYVKDEILALINVDSQYPNMLNQTHVDQLLVFSHQAAIALQNANLVEQIREYTQELETRVQQRTGELEQERALIQIERSQLRAILDAMRDGVVYVDNNRMPIYINNALAEMTGYSEDDWLSGRVFESINGEMPIDRETMWDEIEKHLDNHYFRQDEYDLIRADGSQFTASLIRTEVKNIDDKRVGIVTAIRDISLQKQLEEQKSRFIAYAAHELRTPIANVKTRLFLMKNKPEKFVEHLSIAESAANWMQTLVDNLFDHSRFERGIIQLDLEPIVLQDLTDIIVKTVLPDASNKQIEILPVWDDEAINLFADKSRLRQVITNLINNAIHYSPENGLISITLRKETIEDVPTAVISVNDTGDGIDDKHLPHLFQPFYRASDDTKGAGLGLSIAREIIKAHKGTVDVESQVGEGTTFYVNLPILSESQLLEES